MQALQMRIRPGEVSIHGGEDRSFALAVDTHVLRMIQLSSSSASWSLELG